MNTRRTVITIIVSVVALIAIFVLIFSSSGGAAPEEAGGSSAGTTGGGRTASANALAHYDDPLTGDIGPEWSLQSVVTAPGGQTYMGDFPSGMSPELTLTNSAPHKRVHVVFDLYTHHSWDGSSPGWGPSLFDLSLDDERKLIYTSIGNCGFFTDNNEQAFPDDYPVNVYPGFTLASEKQTMKEIQTFSGNRKYDCSSIYHIDISFPHSANEVKFTFLTSIKDGAFKMFGLGHFHVDFPQELARFTPEQMARLWADLGSGQPEVFWKARWDLVSAGDAAVDYIKAHLEEKIDLNDAQMQKLVDDYSAVKGDERWKPYYDLKVQGPAAKPFAAKLVGQVKDDENASGNLEYFVRLASSQFDRYPLSATETRQQRARSVLMAIHTPAAMELWGMIDVVPTKPVK